MSSLSLIRFPFYLPTLSCPWTPSWRTTFYSRSSLPCPSCPSYWSRCRASPWRSSVPWRPAPRSPCGAAWTAGTGSKQSLDNNKHLNRRVWVTDIIEDDVAPVPLHRGHAPGQEGALEDEVSGEGVSQGVDGQVQQQLDQAEHAQHHPVPAQGQGQGQGQHLERHWPEPGAAWLGGVREDGLETGEGGVGHTDDGPGDEGEEIHGDGVRDGAHEGEIHTLSKQETPSDQQYQISELGAGGAHLILLCFLTGRTSLTSMTAWPLQTSPARAIMQNSGSADNFYRKL